MTIWGIALCFVFMNSWTPVKDSYSLRLSSWRRAKLDCASKGCNKGWMLPAVHKREVVTILRMRGSPPRGDIYGVEGHAVISKYTPKNGVDCGGPGSCFVRVVMVPTPCVESGRRECLLSTGPGLLRHVLLFLPLQELILLC